MSWVRMRMKYAGACAACGGQVAAGEQGLWKRGAGVRHEGCAERDEVACIACGRPAGCASCEFGDDCDLGAVSRPCICAGCAAAGDAPGLYRRSAGRAFPALGRAGRRPVKP